MNKINKLLVLFALVLFAQGKVFGQTNEAQIGGVQYATLAAACTAANGMTGDVIIETLVENITMTSSVTFNKAGLKVTLRSSSALSSPTVIKRGSSYDYMFYINNSSATFTTQDIIFDGKNESTQYTGRAIYVNAGSLSIEGGTTIRNFHTNANGGAVYLAKGGAFINNSSDKDVVFSHCYSEGSSSKNGGAVYSAYGAVTISNTGTGTILFDDCYNTGTSGNDGGAVDVEGDYNITLNNTSSGTIRFNNCRANYGGGMCTDKGTVTFNNTGIGTIEFINCTTISSGTTQRKDAGAVFAGGSFVCENNNGSIVFERCSSGMTSDKRGGGAIFARTSFTLTNTATGTARFVDCSTTGYGGAINVGQASGGSVTITTANTASPIRFENCTANNHYGGAIYQNSGTSMTLTNVMFGGYQTDGDGNVLTDPEDNPLVDSDKACKAKSAGGAVFYNTTSGTVSATNCSFLACESTNGYGGGLVSNSTASNSFSFNNCIFTACEASTHGGGVYLNGGGNFSEGCAFTSCTASSASGNGGGAFFNGTATLGSSNVSFVDCSANNGGGIYFNSSATSSAGSGIFLIDCTATTHGGGLYFNAGTSALNGCSVTGCTAINGGGIYANSTVMLTGCSVSSNTSSASGGGIFASSASGLTLSGCDISSNISSTQGGGIYADNSITLKSNTGVTGNQLTTTTVGDGAGIYIIDGKTLTIGDSGITYDYTTVSGNETSDGKDSNVRLAWDATNSCNWESSVNVQSNLGDYIGVCNPGPEGTKFGTNLDSGGYREGLMFIVSDGDVSPRYGVAGVQLNPSYPSGDVYWKASTLPIGPICKITDSEGHLLTFDNGTIATFTTLKVAV